MTPLRILLIIPAIVYMLIAIIWQDHNINSINGDEPHYLLIADSIIRDGDLEIINNSRIDTPVLRAMPEGYKFISTHDVNGHSVHGIGLPLLLVPMYYIGGVTTAKIFIALLAGCIPFLVYSLTCFVLANEKWAVVTALVVSLSQPFLAASNQIYPDLVIGLIVFYCSIKLLKIYKTQTFSLTKSDILFISLLIGYLPWLHIKSLLPMFLLYFFYSFFCIKLSYTSASNHNCPLFLTISTVTILCSLILLGAYNQHAFGSIYGPHHMTSLNIGLRAVGMIFTGLHIDRVQGLFFQCPLLLIGLIGIVVFVNEARLFAIMVILLYLSIVVPNSTHINWYGGYSFAGRFMWSVVLLWCFPFAYTMKYLLHRGKRTWILAAFFIALSIQAIFASVVLTYPGCLYNTPLSIGDEWLRRSPYVTFLHLTDFQTASFLPSFRDFRNYIKSPVNWAYFSSIICLMFVGYCFIKQKNKTWALICAGFAVCGVTVLLLLPPAIQPIVFRGKDLPGVVGKAKQEYRVATTQDVGFVIFGPHIRLVHGTYEITLDYETDYYKDNNLIWDCVITQPKVEFKMVDKGILPPSQNNNGRFIYNCTLPCVNGDRLFEFRIYSKGDVNISIKRLSIKAISG